MKEYEMVRFLSKRISEVRLQHNKHDQASDVMHIRYHAQRKHIISSVRPHRILSSARLILTTSCSCFSYFSCLSLSSKHIARIDPLPIAYALLLPRPIAMVLPLSVWYPIPIYACTRVRRWKVLAQILVRTHWAG